jgi:hypothetical protein
VQVIAEHFYREGRFEIADQFVAEAGVVGAAESKEPFIQVHNVLKEVRPSRPLRRTSIWQLPPKCTTA